jgi:hypothetical protein
MKPGSGRKTRSLGDGRNVEPGPEGVSDFGGLQGDWQRIHFGAKGFLTAPLMLWTN